MILDEHSQLIVRCFTGCLIKEGNRARGERVYDEMMIYIKNRMPDDNPNDVLYQTLLLIKPSVDLWTKKRGGSSYKLPYLISDSRGFKIAIHWLIREARPRSERSLAERLGAEIIETLKGRSVNNVKRKEEIHKIALANRAFLKYR